MYVFNDFSTQTAGSWKITWMVEQVLTDRKGSVVWVVRVRSWQICMDLWDPDSVVYHREAV